MTLGILVIFEILINGKTQNKNLKVWKKKWSDNYDKGRYKF